MLPSPANRISFTSFQLTLRLTQHVMHVWFHRAFDTRPNVWGLTRDTLRIIHALFMLTCFVHASLMLHSFGSQRAIVLYFVFSQWRRQATTDKFFFQPKLNAKCNRDQWHPVNDKLYFNMSQQQSSLEQHHNCAELEMFVNVPSF
jgi:hypothetical protein